MHEVFNIDHLADGYMHTIDYDSAQYPSGPQFTNVLAGTGSAPLIAPSGALGPAFNLKVGAHSGSVELTGPFIHPTALKGVIVDIEGLGYGANPPLWGLGFYSTDPLYYVDLFRSNTGFDITNQNGNTTTLRTRESLATGNNTNVTNASVGMFLDFVKNQTTVHVGHSLVKLSTNLPSLTTTFKVRALTTSTQDSFDVYMRRIKLTYIK